MSLVEGQILNGQFLVKGIRVMSLSVLSEVSLTANQCLSTLDPKRYGRWKYENCVLNEIQEKLLD